LQEGRNRQIRKMSEQAGLRVHRLVREQISGLSLGKLKPGDWRDLRKAEIKKLLA
jgi:pseudouridine synthase